MGSKDPNAFESAGVFAINYERARGRFWTFDNAESLGYDHMRRPIAITVFTQPGGIWSADFGIDQNYQHRLYRFTTLVQLPKPTETTIILGEKHG